MESPANAQRVDVLVGGAGFAGLALAIALRQGLGPSFSVTVADPAFLAEAGKINMEVQPMAPDAIDKLVADVLRTPAPVVARARVLLGAQNR